MQRGKIFIAFRSRILISILVYFSLSKSVMSDSQCLVNPPKLNSSSGVGTVEEIGGLKTYVSGPADSKLAIILISDIFGYSAPKFRKVVDKVGAAGFLALAPDFFYGDPVDMNNTNFDRDAWRKRHTTDKGYEDAKSVIAALRSKGVTAIGAAGFCWGGKPAVQLTSNADLIKASVLLHPSQVTEDDIKAVKVPIAILGAEKDHTAPELKEFGKMLAKKAAEFDSYVKIFPGVAHGWTVKYMDGDEFSMKSAAEAHQDMINWFAKYVK